MKREDVTILFPEATDKQVSVPLDLNSKDIGKAKGDADQVRAGRFAFIQRVPQTRMYTAITQYDGTTEGQETGGYIKNATTGKNINFLVVHKDAVIQYQKHIAPKIVTPEQNQDADAWKYGYRNVGIAETYQNKVAGIYLHKSTT